jgi:hypothetical protein
MKKFTSAYQKIIKSINVRDKSIINLQGSIPTFEVEMIYEDVAFHKLPRKFTDTLIDIIKEMKANKQVEKVIDIREYLKLIKQEEVENFKEFFKFLNILSNSITEKNLTLKMGFENSFIEPIELYELADSQYLQVFHDEPVKDKLREKINSNNKSNALEIMKDYIDEFTNIGTITINPNLITDKMYKYNCDDNIIGHEIRHFIIFLQRWSKTNYEVCKSYSNKSISYNRNNPEFSDYVLHEDEFITLSATFIERLVNLFLANKRSLKQEEINNLIKSVLVKTGKFDKTLLNDSYWFDILNDDDDKINSIIQFYKHILDDRHYKFENKVKSNKDKFTTLLNWTYRTFFEKIEELKNKRRNMNI